MTRRRGAALLAGLLGVVALTQSACTSSSPDPGPSTIVNTRTETETLSPSQAPLPTLTTAAPLPAQLPAGQTAKECPYIASQDVADIVGSHVYRTLVGTDGSCRFYFYSAPFNAIADITVATYSSPAQAVDAMTRTALKGTEASTQSDIAPGVNGALFRTAFLARDNGQDWACAFTVAAKLVVVRTWTTNASASALSLAAAIAPKI